MLTIRSNLKIKDLDTLSKVLIKPDIINFGLDKVGGGFTDKIADKIITKFSKLDKNKIIVIINDITLQMADKLLEAGYKNIYLAFGRFNKDGSVSKDKTAYNMMKAVIKNNIKQKLNVISLEEIFNMKIDGIICNPPYTSIGANITYTIREKINYEYFVNLLPANDYKRNKTKDLFNYQSEMEAINDGFDDAAVTTHLCLISKTKVNDMTLDGFERSQYIDGSLTKYFYENSKRKHYAIDTAVTNESVVSVSGLDSKKTFMLGERDVNHKVLSASGITYDWNINKNITASEVLASIGRSSGGKKIHFGFIKFNTEIENINFTSFMYNCHKFINKVFTALNVDGSIDINKWAPKVDWTRSWTVEEILADYGYTEEEIAEVMTDLDNFKGMDDQ